MLKIVRASVLMMLLAGAASAGEAPNTVTVVPTPPPTITTQEPLTEETVLPEPTQETAADSFGETLLNLLDSVLALF